MKTNLRSAAYLLSFLVSSAICGPREYEEICSPHKAMEQCRMDLDLICLDNVCVCKDMAYYDEESGACIALIGETCTHIDSSNYFGSSTAISRCPLNAVCETKNPNKIPKIPEQYKHYLHQSIWSSSSNDNHKCFCKPGYTVDDDKEDCSETLKANDICIGANITSECDYGAGMTCDKENSKTCVCKNSEETFYSEEENRCLTKLDKNCTQTTFCEKNSICSTTLSIIKSKIEDKHLPSSRKIGKCVCLPGYNKNSEGNCVASYGVSCSEHNSCNLEHSLECIEGICQCQAGLHQVFSSTHGNGTCKYLVNSVCDSKEEPECVENAHCDEGTSKCKCIEGYSASPAGQCLPSHLTECTSPDFTNQTSGREYNFYYRYFRESYFMQNKNNVTTCNFYQGLACFNSKCECFDSALTWDATQSMCTAGVDERCGPVTWGQGFDGEMDALYPHSMAVDRPRPHPEYAYYVGCADGMKCVKNFHGVQDWRVCEPIVKTSE